MNDRRRQLLKTAIQYLNKAEAYASQALDGEQDCLDNMPEILQQSEKTEKIGGCY